MTAQDEFRVMMREQIAPSLRGLGFKGSGQVYVLPSDTHWAMLSFQKSAYSTSQQIRFAVNYGVTTREAWEHHQQARGAPVRPTPSWLHNGTIADPEGAPGGRQRWWQLRLGDALDVLADDVVARIKREALPEMKRLMD